MGGESIEELRPTSSLLARIGGILIALGGVLLMVFSALNIHPHGRPGPMPYSFWGGLILGLVAVILGCVIYAIGERIRTSQSNVTLWCVLVIVLGAISLGAAGWLTAIGFIVALIGGIIGIVWSLQRPGVPSPPAFAAARACPACGAINSSSADFCQKCGKPLLPR